MLIGGSDRPLLRPLGSGKNDNTNTSTYIETINKLVRTSRYLVQELGREPTPEEIAERMDMPVDKARKVLKIAKEPISLETPVGEEEDSHLGDFIEDKKVS